MNLDQEAVERLAIRFSLLLSEHLVERPTVAAANYEALKALALAMAPIIAAARTRGVEAEARAFFQLALDKQVNENLEDERVQILRIVD